MPIVDPSTESYDRSFICTCCYSSNTLVQWFARCLICLHNMVSNLLSAVFCKRWFYPTVFSKLASSDLRIVFIMVAVRCSVHLFGGSLQ